MDVNVNLEASAGTNQSGHGACARDVSYCHRHQVYDGVCGMEIERSNL